VKTTTGRTQRDNGRRSIFRLAISGVSFFGAAFLAFLVYKAITILASGFQYESMLLYTSWALVNIASFLFVGVGFLCGRPRLTAIGGGVLALSTIALIVLKNLAISNM
jgi:hypothetical protein